MSKQYKLAILIGRFQPFHLGHLANFNKAYEVADNVLILVGSSFQPRTIKNPFTYEDREHMIRSTLADSSFSSTRYSISPIGDYSYNDNLWIRNVQEEVSKFNINDKDIAILGHEKDESSWYLRAFPGWTFLPLSGFVEHGSKTIDATKIRELYFEGHHGFIKGAVPNIIFNELTKFTFSAEYTTLVEEYEFIKSYKSQWAVAPYAPTFFTVDSVVLQGGHILLVKRKHAPGKDLWAMPGGFLNQNETARVACIRELREETGLKVPEPVLNGSITYEQLFDKPDRSLRGRTLTQAFLIELNGGDTKLPKVRGMDDAADAKWFPINEVLGMSDRLFEDHHSIITSMVSRAK